MLLAHAAHISQPDREPPLRVNPGRRPRKRRRSAAAARGAPPEAVAAAFPRPPSPDSPMLPSTAIFFTLPSSRPRLGGVAMESRGDARTAPAPAANGRNGNNRRPLRRRLCSPLGAGGREGGVGLKPRRRPEPRWKEPGAGGCTPGAGWGAGLGGPPAHPDCGGFGCSVLPFFFKPHCVSPLPLVWGCFFI